MIDVVCGVMEDPAGRFLACQRPLGKRLGGLWEFPGGKVDPGESPEIALARELREELGIEVAVGSAMKPVACTYDWGCIRLLPYRCVITGGHLRAIEHEELRWCAPGDFGGLAWAEADLPILDEIRAGIGKITPD